jgi:hypothetical protein
MVAGTRTVRASTVLYGWTRPYRIARAISAIGTAMSVEKEIRRALNRHAFDSAVAYRLAFDRALEWAGRHPDAPVSQCVKMAFHESTASIPDDRAKLGLYWWAA